MLYQIPAPFNNYFRILSGWNFYISYFGSVDVARSCERKDVWDLSPCNRGISGKISDARAFVTRCSSTINRFCQNEAKHARQVTQLPQKRTAILTIETFLTGAINVAVVHGGYSFILHRTMTMQYEEPWVWIQTITTIRYELRTRPHPFALSNKDNRNFISRLIYKKIY